MKTDVSRIFVGQTLRFLYGMSEQYTTVTVVAITSQMIQATIECGKNRGKAKQFQIYEIVNCQEIFGSSLLYGLLKKVKTLD